MRENDDYRPGCADRIGILTFHCADNFGAMLQAYGLLSWLSGHGFDAFVVNYVPTVLRGREWLFPYIPIHSLKEWVRQPLRGFCKNVWTGREWRTRKRRMSRFRREYLTKGDRVIHQLKALSKVKADVLIVGSDQIWNPDMLYGFQPAYFGAFENSRIRKIIAYGASFGTASLPEHSEKEFAELLSSVHEISMREKSAAEYVERRFQRKAAHVVDPVFLLDADQWRGLKRAPGQRGFILYYETEYNENLRRAACRAAREKGLEVVELSPVRRRKRWPFQMVYSAGPREFLGYIDAAEYVFTNSFHGAAFSILLHKPFYLCNYNIAGARIESLLQSTGLAGRMAEGNYKPDLEEAIDWESVDSRLQKSRGRSEEFLRRSLTL